MLFSAVACSEPDIDPVPGGEEPFNLEDAVVLQKAPDKDFVIMHPNS